MSGYHTSGRAGALPAGLGLTRSAAGRETLDCGGHPAPEKRGPAAYPKGRLADSVLGENDLKHFRLLLLAGAVGGLAVPAWPQAGGRGFGGPSILSRGLGSLGRSGGEPLTFTPWMSAQTSYYTGLTTVSANSQGGFQSNSSYGLTLNLGGYVNYHGNHKTVSMDYVTHFRYVPKRNYFTGNDHFLSLRYTQQVSSRVSFYLSQGASIFSYGFGGYGNSINGSVDSGLGFGFGNIGFNLADPSTSVFDSRTYALSSSAGLTYQKSSRLIFGMSGGGFFVRRHSKALFGSDGYRASGNMTYLLSERAGIGVNYSYGRFVQTQNYGEMNINSVGMHYYRPLTEHWHLSFHAGVQRSVFDRLRSVPLDPVTALLLGAGATFEPISLRRDGINGGAGVSRSFKRSSISFTYGRGVTPGNEILLGGESERFRASYGFIAIRKLNIGTHANYSRQSSFSQAGRRFRSYGVGAGTNYLLFSLVSATVRVDVRQIEIAGTSFKRTQLYATGGLSFHYSPGQIPLSFW